MSYVQTSGKLALSDRTHSWVDKDGGVWSLLDLGPGNEIVFASAEDARQVAARCLVIADEIDAKTAELAAAAS